jgi:hypothetical protein
VNAFRAATLHNMHSHRNSQTQHLSNIEIAGLLAAQAQDSRQPLSKVLNRASRKAFLWEEAAQPLAEGPLFKSCLGWGLILKSDPALG